MIWEHAAMYPEEHPSTKPMRELIIEGFMMGKKMNSALERHRENRPRSL